LKVNKSKKSSSGNGVNTVLFFNKYFGWKKLECNV